MVKRICKRFISLMISAVMLFSIFAAFPISAYAAVSGTLSGLSNEDIGASYTGTDDGTYSSWSVTGGNSILGNVISEDGACDDTNYNTTLTLTNNKSTEAILSFDYEIEQNDGTIQVAGTAVTEDGSYSGTLSAGESIRIYIASGSTDNATTITITNLFLIVDVETTTTFQPAENGSYTVDDETITEETVRTQQSTEAYSLCATADEGYKFLGWYSVTDETYISSEENTSLLLDSDQTITAVFVSEDTPIFNVGGSTFTDLNEADAYAVANGVEKITLVSDGTLSAGNYTISEGVILLIPFDESGTCYTTEPATTGNSYTTPYCYRTLTMENGANITVNGSISVSAMHTAQGNGFNGNAGGGAPSGGYGYIYMEDGSTITINEDGGLYVYGYLSGDGTVTAKSGAVVYENMQIKDFRGGSVTSSLAGNSQKVFPFNQYFVQNIEAKLILESGADEYVYSSLYATLMASTVVHFVGDGGLFELADGSTFIKQYIPDEDVLEMSVDGDASINSLSITVALVTVSSEDYVLPITNGMRLNVMSGTTDITQDVALLAGVELNVSEGAALHVESGHNVYVYDRDEWIAQNYASNATFKTVTYSPTRTYTRTQSDLTDVKIDLNGTLIADGYVYTTEGGADIISSEGTGEFVMNGGAGTETVTYQVYGTGPTYVDIPITSAKLHNGSTYSGTEDEYTLTDGAEAGSVYIYDLSTDMWEKEALAQDTYTVTWVNDDGTVLEIDEDVAYGTLPEYNGETPEKDGDAQYSYTFAGWTPEISEVTGDITYKAVYEQTVNTYTITWKNWDGETLLEESVAYGEVPSYSGEQPVKESDGEYTYTFSGWTPEITVVTGDAEYTAVFTESVNSYTVTWVDWDGTVLETDEDVAYGTTPEYNGATPEREGDAQYSYTFSGWSPSVDTVTGDITYTAVYEQTLKEYTITWMNGDTVLKVESVAYGETPVYSGETPVKEGDAQYSYTFSGWSPEVTSVTGDATYTAVFDQTVNTYTVTWVNADGTVLETDEDVAYGTMPEYNGETPEKESDSDYTYTFSGWSPEITAVTGNITYTAQFTATAIEKPEYTVTFDANGGEGTMEPQTFVQGVETSLNENTFTRDGYQFTGWNTAADGSGVTYADGEALIDLTEDITLYAQWKLWNGWFTDEIGTGYVQDGEILVSQWKTIDGSTYYFKEDGYIAKGVYETVSQDGSETALFVFDDSTGVFLSDSSGLHDSGADTYWVENGVVVKDAGLVRIVLDSGEVNYYYFGADGKAYKGTDEQTNYLVEKNNGLGLPAGIYYSFESNGVISHFADTSINGIYYDEESGNYYYCVDGIIIANGLMEIDGYYYYARTSTGAFVTSQTYWITKTNGLLDEGIYTFNEKGQIVFPDESEKKNGIVEENGSLYYYVDGVVTGAGLIQIDGNYYYVKTSTGEVVHGQTYWITATNDLLPSGIYTFDESGRLVEEKNGIVEENGSLYYYVDGVLTGAGLIQIDGDYYYVKTSTGEVVHGQTYWITATNDLLPSAIYTFDDEGKLIQSEG